MRGESPSPQPSLRKRGEGEEAAALRYPLQPVPRWTSASPADARKLVVAQPASLPDGRAGRRATGSGCRKSRSLYPHGPLHRDRIADAARIVDRAVEPPRIGRSRRNTADAGILGRRSRSRRQKTEDCNGQARGSACPAAAREHRDRLRVAHSVILSRLVISEGKNLEGGAEVPMAVSVSFKTSTLRQTGLTRASPAGTPAAAACREASPPSWPPALHE